MVQSYDKKMKETLDDFILKSEEKLQIYNHKLLKMNEQLTFFKENSTKVNYFYNNIVVKKFADKINRKKLAKKEDITSPSGSVG